ncbi:hypothetical protein ACQEVF_17740 [Nonomuraea polychroma]|uniref:hypothetical protein n=1 Tax=Nonomuraea polychroma TaxID=46176 RepID=UPI003D8F7E22
MPTHSPKARVDRGDTVMLDCQHEDNPVLFDDDGQLMHIGRDYIGELDKLTGVRHAWLRKGLWVAAEGLIFEDYDPAVHLLDRFDIPPGWTRWWSVDFGFTNPQVIRGGQRTRTGGSTSTGRFIAPGARWTSMLRMRSPKSPTAKDGGPSPGLAASSPTTTPKAAVLERELGMCTIAARKQVAEGIKAVEARLRHAGDGKPRLFILRDSLVERDQELADAKRPTRTAEEIVGYVWDQAPGKPPKEVPVKENDHGMDAARYLIADRDLGARPRVRWM